MAPLSSPFIPSPSLQLDHIRLERGGRCLINDLSLQLNPGDALILTGPNGSGKSSLLRLIAGLCPITAGTLSRQSPIAWLGPENALKPTLTVEQNLRLFTPHDTGAIFGALQQLQLPHLLDCPTRLLSLGQKRRVALARLILAQAPLWLLDEPANALDSASLSLLESLIATHRSQGGTLITASHTPISLPNSSTLTLGPQVRAEHPLAPPSHAIPNKPQSLSPHRVSSAPARQPEGGEGAAAACSTPANRKDTPHPAPFSHEIPNEPQSLPPHRVSSAPARQPEGGEGAAAACSTPANQTNAYQHCPTEQATEPVSPQGVVSASETARRGDSARGGTFHPFLLHLRRELHLTCHHGTESLSGLLFLTLCSTLFPLALGPSPRLLQQTGPAILWVCTLLACLLPLERLYNADAEDGSLDMLHITLHPGLIALGKIIIHWLTASLPVLLATPLLALFYQLPFNTLSVLLLSLTLGSMTLALIGGMTAAITTGARRNTLLLPLLSLPLMTPGLIFGTLACTNTNATSLRANLSLQGALLLLALPFCPLIAGNSLKDTRN